MVSATGPKDTTAGTNSHITLYGLIINNQAHNKDTIRDERKYKHVTTRTSESKKCSGQCLP